jgi:hypothetical protein
MTIVHAHVFEPHVLSLTLLSICSSGSASSSASLNMNSIALTLLQVVWINHFHHELTHTLQLVLMPWQVVWHAGGSLF